jgi:hypothetical protein
MPRNSQKDNTARKLGGECKKAKELEKAVIYLFEDWR